MAGSTCLKVGEDNISLEAIAAVYGLSKDDAMALVQRKLKPSSFHSRAIALVGVCIPHFPNIFCRVMLTALQGARKPSCPAVKS
ncbi:protein of unknown function (DUF2805) [Rubidibacter lacunae KORDI 51-2]|uniref:Uncharacterized protein n=1 Tax=Rubidibacter lacunae KORDI 51-2 TaxID=582515 RepID=U5DHD1_9CHRO|nr:protein of unknown function (DUF2805) [Rubidibacter lacunae KORDI 51-2]